MKFIRFMDCFVVPPRNDGSVPDCFVPRKDVLFFGLASLQLRGTNQEAITIN